MKSNTQTSNAAPKTVTASGNFAYLFFGLLLFFLTVPYNHLLSGLGRYSIVLLFTLFMLIAVWSLSSSRHIYRLGLLLAVSLSSLSGIDLFFGYSEPIMWSGYLLLLIFCCLSCWIAAQNVFVLHQVNFNSLVGAFCVYLLLGLIWAILYCLLHFNGWAVFSGNITDQPHGIFPEMLYFSFVTLASLGYGDIAPASNLIRTLAYLEAVTGQFYLAVMVASLVGAFTSHRIQH